MPMLTGLQMSVLQVVRIPTVLTGFRAVHMDQKVMPNVMLKDVVTWGIFARASKRSMEIPMLILEQELLIKSMGADDSAHTKQLHDISFSGNKS